ncbi:MAG: hypothetical protein IPP52_16095 [Ignavibacteria bacterium]|nr:hypothetical protein [Ignavibacteria bacterium]
MPEEFTYRDKTFRFHRYFKDTDALLSTTPGYGTLVSGCWTGSYTGTAGTQGNFTVVKLSASNRTVLISKL